MSGDALFKKAVELQKQEKFSEAFDIYRDLARAEPTNAAVWHNLGSVLRRLDLLDASREAHEKALALSPGKPGFLSSYGNTLRDLGRMDEALKAHASAVAAAPGDAMILKNYATALRDFGRFEEALAHFEVALKINPGDIYIPWDMGVTHMYLGNYTQGWAGLESRWKHPQMKQPRVSGLPRWTGEDIAGKTLLVLAEQGFGDTILCSRYIPLVKKRGARIILECKKDLHRLFSTVEGLDAMIVPDEVLKEKPDFYVTMMSLPHIFKTELATIPPPARLFTDASLPPLAAKLLEQGQGKKKIGIVWSGSVTFLHNDKRSVSTEHFMPLADIPGVQLYSLQKGPREKELAECDKQGKVFALGPYLNDFADTAAVLKQLDLVIMTDSSVAHLAGTMGKSVWNLLNYQASYWLYLWGRKDSPWYPSMRLFRQLKPGDWDSVFSRVAEELLKFK